METVSFDLITKIRLHINRTEKQAELLKNRMKWNKLTSALDVLEDTSWAIEYYIESEYPTDIRGKYLYTYGLLQSLFVQQDAVISINEALFEKKIKIKDDYPYASKVRSIRNDTIGHPTNRNSNKQFVSIAQTSMEKNGFYYCIDDSEDYKKDEIVDVDIINSIEDTAKCVNDVLKKAVDDLDKEFKEYIEKHKGRKMADIFNNLQYAEEKALLDTTMREWGYNAAKGMVAKCEEELIRRYGSVAAADSYKFLLDDIHELYVLIDSVYNICSKSRDKIWHYLVELLFVKLHELESYCEETDEYFENYGQLDYEETSSADVNYTITDTNGNEIDKELMG